jgi:hypothetical protein
MQDGQKRNPRRPVFFACGHTLIIKSDFTMRDERKGDVDFQLTWRSAWNISPQLSGLTLFAML